MPPLENESRFPGLPGQCWNFSHGWICSKKVPTWAEGNLKTGGAESISCKHPSQKNTHNEPELHPHWRQITWKKTDEFPFTFHKSQGGWVPVESRKLQHHPGGTSPSRAWRSGISTHSTFFVAVPFAAESSSKRFRRHLKPEESYGLPKVMLSWLVTYGYVVYRTGQRNTSESCIFKRH